MNSGHQNAQVNALKQRIDKKLEISEEEVLALAPESCKNVAVAKWIQENLGNPRFSEEFTKTISQYELGLLESKDCSKSIMRDIYGNYVVQKMLELNSQSQKDLLFKMIHPQAQSLSFDEYGCRVI